MTQGPHARRESGSPGLPDGKSSGFRTDSTASHLPQVGGADLLPKELDHAFGFIELGGHGKRDAALFRTGSASSHDLVAGSVIERMYPNLFVVGQFIKSARALGTNP
jgi:hypothetical protein